MRAACSGRCAAIAQLLRPRGGGLAVADGECFRRRLWLGGCLRRRDPHDVVDAAEKKLMLSQSEIFDEVGRQQKAHDKSAFMKALQIYEQKQSVHRRAHVEFVYAAMARMEEFGVHKDLAVYKALFDIFPKKVMVPVNMWQAEMMHYPKQQDCALDILQKMENNGLIPDDQVGDLIVNTFGIRSHVMRKYQRMMYWMPKFKHMNPYPVPATLPTDPIALACLALKRMAVDPENRITVAKISDSGSITTDGSLGDGDASESQSGSDGARATAAEHRRFVVSAQSPEQASLLAEQPASAVLYVDGPHLAWLRDKNVKYFVLQTDGHSVGNSSDVSSTPDVRPTSNLRVTDDSWLDTLDSSLTGERTVRRQEAGRELARSSVHRQHPGGIVLAMCVPWTAHREAALAWITVLQKDNQHLGRLGVVLKLRTASGEAPACEEVLHQRLLDVAEQQPQGQQQQQQG